MSAADPTLLALVSIVVAAGAVYFWRLWRWGADSRRLMQFLSEMRGSQNPPIPVEAVFAVFLILFVLIRAAGEEAAFPASARLRLGRIGRALDVLAQVLPESTRGEWLEIWQSDLLALPRGWQRLRYLVSQIRGIPALRRALLVPAIEDGAGL